MTKKRPLSALYIRRNNIFILLVNTINTAFFWVSLLLSFLVFSNYGYFVSVFTKNKQLTLWKAINLWGRFIIYINRINLDVAGLENFNNSECYIFAANHQSIIDIIVLCAVIPIPFVFVTKSNLFKIPLFGRYLKNAGFINVTRNNSRKDYATIIDSIHNNKSASIMIFPEGTRSVNGELGYFKTGIVKFAKMTKFKTVPISISGTMNIMAKGSLWFSVGKVKIIIGNPIVWTGQKEQHLKDLKEAIKIGVFKTIEETDSKPDQFGHMDLWVNFI